MGVEAEGVEGEGGGCSGYFRRGGEEGGGGLDVEGEESWL